jgi:hypothetical protein
LKLERENKMATKIETVFSTGAMLYTVIHNPNDGTIWNTANSAWETFNASVWAQYAISMTEQATTGYYEANYPTAISGVLTTEVCYQQSGSSPAISDAPATGIGQSQGSNVAAIANSTTAASTLAISVGTMPTGAIVSGTLTSTAFTTSLADTTDNVYQGRLIIFTSGALVRQVGNITAYSGSTFTIMVGGAFTSAPSAGDTFIIV